VGSCQCHVTLFEGLDLVIKSITGLHCVAESRWFVLSLAITHYVSAPVGLPLPLPVNFLSKPLLFPSTSLPPLSFCTNSASSSILISASAFSPLCFCLLFPPPHLCLCLLSQNCFCFPFARVVPGQWKYVHSGIEI